MQRRLPRVVTLPNGGKAFQNYRDELFPFDDKSKSSYETALLNARVRMPPIPEWVDEVRDGLWPDTQPYFYCEHITALWRRKFPYRAGTDERTASSRYNALMQIILFHQPEQTANENRVTN